MFMTLIKPFLYLLCSTVLCLPLVIVICNGEESSQAVLPSHIQDTTGNACESGDITKCRIARDTSLAAENYEKAFSMMRTLCERYDDSESCYMTYSTYYAMQSNNEKSQSEMRVTLYEVLYFLDLGCKLNNYDSCMRAARIYEYGVKPGTSQALYGYNIAYDAQEAKKYYKKVCESVSDNAYEACNRLLELTNSNKESLSLSN